MKKFLLLPIVPALIMLFIYGCAAEIDNNMPQGYGNGAADEGDTVLPGIPGTGGTSIQYERGREDYPGQNYASLVGTGKNASGGVTADNTGIRLSADGVTPANESSLVLRSVTSPVRQGETCVLSVQGRPDTEYTITGVYRYSGDMVTSTAVRRSGDNGIVELEWNVSARTEPGTYGIMISGGGEQITASYTVVE